VKKIIPAALALLVLIAAGLFAVKSGIVKFPPGIGPKNAISSPEEALPDVGGSDAYVLASVADTASLSSAISIVSGVLSSAGEWPGLPDAAANLSGDEFKTALSALGYLKNFVDTSTELAVYVTSSDVSELYVSMFADDQKFDSFIAGKDLGALRVNEWKTDKADDGNAWMLDSPLGERGNKPLFYVTRRRVGDFSLVNIATKEDGIDRMRLAASDASKRLGVTRSTEGPNFVKVRFKEPLRIENWTLGEAETSWESSGAKLRIQSFSDMYDRMISASISRDFVPTRPPILGEGELVLLATFDPVLYGRSILPGEEDPIGVLVDTYGSSIPAELAGDLKSILRNCRISSVLVADKNSDAPQIAYIALETSAVGSVDKLYGLASMFLGAGKELEGWESAYSIAASDQLNIVLVRRGGMVLLGVGKLDDYAKNLAVSPEIENFVSPSNVVGAYATSRLLDLKGEFMTKSIFEGIEEAMNKKGVPDSIREIIGQKSIGTLGLKQTADGRSYIDISWKE
jgi:hypothetical protein